MLNGKATGFNKKASHTTLQHRVVPAEAHAEFPQHSLNKLLLGEEALATLSSQLTNSLDSRSVGAATVLQKTIPEQSTEPNRQAPAHTPKATNIQSKQSTHKSKSPGLIIQIGDMRCECVLCRTLGANGDGMASRGSTHAATNRPAQSQRCWQSWCTMCTSASTQDSTEDQDMYLRLAWTGTPHLPC
jgi:hypothetical protein